MSTYGTTTYGGSGGLPTVTVTGVVTTAGPALTVDFNYSSPDGQQMQTVRCQVVASDGRTAPNGTPFYYDSGWTDATLASGGAGTFEILDAVTEGIPTDTGSGSIDPTLHLEVRISASPDLDPDTTGNWSTGQYDFDLQWGDPSITWEEQPSNLVTTPQVAVSWNFSDNRNTAQGSYELILETTDETTVYYDSGQTTGSSGGPYTLPYELTNGQSYRIYIRAWNLNGVPAPSLSAIFVAGEARTSQRPVGGPLRRFLAMLAFQLDVNRSLVEQLRNANNPLTCPGNLLPALAQQLGVQYEADMGMAQTRKLLANVVHQYKEKGTFSGVEGISKALTGWGATAASGPNLMLNLAQVLSPIAAVTNLESGTLGNSGTTPIMPAAYTGGDGPTSWPSDVTVQTNSAVAAEAFWRATGQSVSTTIAWSVVGSGAVTEMGIPIPPGASEVSGSLELWVNGFAAVPAFDATIRFFNGTGGTISDSSATVITPTQGQWAHFSLNGIAVPSGTVWASLRLTPATPLNFDYDSAVMVVAFPYLAIEATASAYTRPRELEITLDATRINLVKNPSFENNSTTGWAATTNAAISASNTAAYQPPDTPNPGTYSLSVVAQAAGNMSVTSDPMPVRAEELYTASAYFYSGTNARELYMELLLYDASSNLLETVTGGTFMETVGQWTRAWVQTDPASSLPAGTVQAAIRVNWTAAAAAGQHLMDCVLFEQGWAVRPYFDGDLFNGGPHDADYMWEGPGQVGPSFYYRNYSNALTRLDHVLNGTAPSALGQKSPLSLTGFVPLGSTYTLKTPQPV